MSLDARTLVLFGTLVGIVLCIVLAVFRRGLPESVHGAGLWAAAMGLQAAGALLIGLRSLGLSDGVLLPIGNTLLFGGHLAQYAAVLRFFDRSVPRVTFLLGLVAFYVATLWFTAVTDSFPMRSATFSFGAAAVLGLVGWTLLRQSAHIDAPSAQFTGAVTAATAIILVTRGFYTLGLGDSARSLFQGDPVQFGFIATYTLFGIVSTLGFILMISDRLRAEVGRLATLDSLTGIYNRRTLTDLALREVARATRHGSSVALLLIDLDHFKSINDRFGHPAGDRVLQSFVATIGMGLRKQDLIGRYGGEEFCVVLPATPAHEALTVAQRLRTAVEDSIVEIDGKNLTYTVSIGVAHSDDVGLEADALLQAADRALYQAKRRGRNQVVTAPSEETPPRAAPGTGPTGDKAV